MDVKKLFGDAVVRGGITTPTPTYWMCQQCMKVTVLDMTFFGPNVCGRCGCQMRWKNVTDALRGPTFWIWIKTRDRWQTQQCKPTGRPYVEAWTLNLNDQTVWYFLTGSNGKEVDYETHCGQHRGPGLNRVLAQTLYL